MSQDKRRKFFIRRLEMFDYHDHSDQHELGQHGHQPAIRTDQADPQNPASGIDTNKQALVTIDADLPTGAVVTLPPTATNSTFTVSRMGLVA